MANVKATSNGSGMFSKQHAEKAHLLKHGVPGEVADVRLDISAALSPEAAITIDEWDGPSTSAVLILSQTPKVRMGAALVLAEALDGAAVSPITGTLTQPGGPGTAWQYNPGTVVNAATAAAVTGTADVTAAALYGASGTLNGLTLILTVNSQYAVLTFHGVSSSLSEANMLAAIAATWPGLTVTQGGGGANKLVLTDKLKGSTQSIVVGAGTANTALGLSAATTSGTGHSYSVQYEYDATQTKDATGNVVGAPPYVNVNQGP